MKSLLKGTLCLLLIVVSISTAISQEQNAIQGTVITPMGGIPPAVAIIAKPYPIAPFTGQEQTIQELYELIEFDLAFSGGFIVKTENDMPQAAYQFGKDRERQTIDYASWKTLRVKDSTGMDLPVDYIVVPQLKPRGENQFALHMLVYNVAEGLRAIGRAYGGEPHAPFPRSAMRRAGHKATAEIIRTLREGREVPITESRIAFVNHDKAKNTKEIYVIDYDGWKGSVQRITFFDSATLFPDWSPSGDALAYTSLKDDWADSFVHDLRTGKITTLAKFKGTNTTPRWAPDGENLAISLSAEGNAEIYLMNKNGGKPKQRITHNPAGDISPDISPSGDQIAFTSDRIGAPKIYVSDIEGSNPRRLTYFDRKCDTPFWSPIPPPWYQDKDLRIAFCGFYDSLQGDIFTIKPDGTEQLMISDGRADNKNPTWAPNARYIAYASNQLGKFDIFIARSDGKPLPTGEMYYRVTYQSGDNLQPSWSPN